MEGVQKRISFGFAIVTILILSIILLLGLAILKLPTQLTFIFAIVAITLCLLFKGFKLTEVQEYLVEGGKKSVLVVLILISVGMIIGAWIVSGIVPSLIYYGLKLLSPSFFLVAGFLICCIVSFFTGSSYASVGTLGVAFMGIGHGMGVTPALTAGMVLSGSIFGDKMSPFSDTTNLASGSAGTDIFSHIRSMLYTTIPALIISAILYTILGFKYDGNMEVSRVNVIIEALSQHFTISPLLLLVPVITIILAIKKMPPLISLSIGAFIGVIAAFGFQSYSSKVILTSLVNGFTIDSGVKDVDNLLNRGGISSMMSTVTIAIFALALGEVLLKTGIVSVILDKIKSTIISPMRLVITTLLTCLLTNMLTASEYVAIVLPGEMLQPAYRKRKIQLRVLSRTLEDGGTIFSFLVPWSAAAIYVSGILGVSTIDYIPYTFFAILCPIFAVIYAITGFAIFKEEGYEDFKVTDQQQDRFLSK